MPFNKLETEALRGCFQQFVRDLDVECVLDYLYQESQIDKSVIMKYKDRKVRHEAVRDFLLSDVEQCSFQVFRRSLQGYLHLKVLLDKSLNTVVRQAMESVTPDKAVLFAVETKSPHCIKVNIAYHQMCDFYYNGNSNTFLTVYNDLERLWYYSNGDSSKCLKKLSDLFFKLTLLYSRHLAFMNEFENADTNFNMLQRVLPLTSNPSLFEMIMVRKKAVMYSIRNMVPEAQSQASDAVCRASCLSTCKDKIKSMYTSCGIALVHYEHQMSREERENQISVLMNIRHALRSLDEESQKAILKTKIITYILPGLIVLTVGKRGIDFGMSDILEKDITNAEDRFSTVGEDNIWTAVAAEWKTVLFIEKAEISLFRKDAKRAKGFIDYAEHLANDLQNLPFLKENVEYFKRKYNLDF